jgi:hypothetical protein
MVNVILLIVVILNVVEPTRLEPTTVEPLTGLHSFDTITSDIIRLG